MPVLLGLLATVLSLPVLAETDPCGKSQPYQHPPGYVADPYGTITDITDNARICAAHVAGDKPRAYTLGHDYPACFTCCRESILLTLRLTYEAEIKHVNDNEIANGRPALDEAGKEQVRKKVRDVYFAANGNNNPPTNDGEFQDLLFKKCADKCNDCFFRQDEGFAFTRESNRPKCIKPACMPIKNLDCMVVNLRPECPQPTGTNSNGYLQGTNAYRIDADKHVMKLKEAFVDLGRAMYQQLPNMPSFRLPSFGSWFPAPGATPGSVSGGGRCCFPDTNGTGSGVGVCVKPNENCPQFYPKDEPNNTCVYNGYSQCLPGSRIR